MAELAVRSPHDRKVVGLNPAGSKKKISDLTTKLKPYYLLQHMVINTHGWMITHKGIQTYTC